jgi:ParB-like chromosome segregation protein Spo0J
MAAKKLVQYARVPIANLEFDPSNARVHSKINLKAIRGSLAKFGQQKPIVVTRDNIVIAGNGTLAAATELGWTEIDVVYTELTGPEAMAYALADNRTADLADWDKGILGAQLQSLYDDGFEIAHIGFEPADYLSGINLNGTAESDISPPDIKNEWLVVVECRDEAHQEEIYQQLKDQGESCKLM